jgi:ABC-2 type transport system permease protein
MITPPPLPLPPVGTSPNLRHAMGGVWRLTWRQVFAPSRWLIASILLLALGLLSGVAIGQQGRGGFDQWATGFYLTVLIPVAAFLSGAGAIRDDVRSSTVDYVITRPIPKTAFVLFRFLSQLACIQIVGLLAFGVLLAAAVYRGVPGLGSQAVPLWWAQVLALTAFTALGFLCAALTSRYLVLGLLYGAVIEVGLGQIPIQLNRLSILHHIRVLVENQPARLTAETATATGLVLLIAAGLVAAAALVFSWRELAGDQPKDT